MTIGDRLRAARAEKGWSLQDVAKRTGGNKNTLWMYESGRNQPSTFALFGLAMLFGKPVQWFRHGDDGLEPPDTGAGQRIPVHPILITGIVRDTMVFEFPDLGSVDVPFHILQDAPRAFALRVTDHSLSLLGVRQGSMVIVDPDAPFVDGKLYPVRIDGEERPCIRQIFREPRAYRIVDSEGATVTREVRQVEILGRIIWSMVKM